MVGTVIPFRSLLVSNYPTVIGFDIAGLVLEVGENVPLGPCTNNGRTRERCLVPWQHAIPLPDEDMPWSHAASLSVAIQVLLTSWDVMGITCSAATANTSPSAEKNRNKKCEAVLIWGASSSIGSMGVQSAQLLRDDQTSPFAAVYATAGSANHDYIRSLGADRVFDYKDAGVIDAIFSAASQQRLVIRHGFLTNGSLEKCQVVLKAFLGAEKSEDKDSAKIASVPLIPSDVEVVNGVERLRQFQRWMGICGRRHLADGLIGPSPEIKVVGKGIDAVNAGCQCWVGYGT
ncbi:hypothetical protein BKA66DRAFT_516104 [Pyrenochaeta sp. MPI-SDFR-AT-0127]|nr:hypothetical protein BKA66DRAFT_516104 [Pyrenochaeta sp. MPI-SDFR-AT-0127]